MAFQPGNELWKLANVGRPKLFSSGDELWQACLAYFKWVEDNPLHEGKVVKEGDKNIIMALPKMRAMTIGGLCLHIGMTHETWCKYREEEAFSEITTRADAIIREQKFGGAAAELLNPNIIARDLGLRDGMEHTGKDGGPMEIRTKSDEELDAEIRRLQSLSTGV